MVNTIIKIIALFVLLLPAIVVGDTCTTDWSCSDWSECAFNGYKVRSCEDANNCNAIESPIELKPCYDTKLYTPENTEVMNVNVKPDVSETIEPSSSDNSSNNFSEDEQTVEYNSQKTPNKPIGFGIILMFLIAGFLIGKYFIRKKD